MRLQNLHTHSVYCDGADTPEEMIKSAIEKGFYSIGFSGHAYVPDSMYSMTPENTVLYKKEINELKKKYEGQIKVFCGLEVDKFSETDLSGYDYLIGSIHYIEAGGTKFDVDHSPEKTESIINEFFSGDGLLYAREYYRSLGTLYEYGKFDIIGHFDLITKFCEKKIFFDTNTKEYRNMVIEAAESLAGKIPLFEVNTGAISRGYRTSPYPEPFILKEMKRLGFGAIVTSDCHNRNMLECAYNESFEFLRENGFKEIYILTENGFEAECI